MLSTIARTLGRPLTSLGRWELAQLRPKHLRAAYACSELAAAEALAGAYVFAFWRSTRHPAPVEAEPILLEQEHRFMEALTQTVEREAVRQSDPVLGVAYAEIARALAALEALCSDFGRYAERLEQVVVGERTPVTPLFDLAELA